MANFTNQTKNTATMQGGNKAGAGWRYEEPDIDYEMTILYYDTYGTAITWTNQALHSASITNQTKN